MRPCPLPTLVGLAKYPSYRGMGAATRVESFPAIGNQIAPANRSIRHQRKRDSVAPVSLSSRDTTPALLAVTLIASEDLDIWPGSGTGVSGTRKTVGARAEHTGLQVVRLLLKTPWENRQLLLFDAAGRYAACHVTVQCFTGVPTEQCAMP